MKRQFHLRCRGLAGGGVLALACVLGAGAGAQSLDPLVRITHRSPLAGCKADNVALQEATLGSTLYKNTEIEPWVAVDPTDASRLLVGHQQDRWSDGGARGLTGNASSDGGATWAPTVPSGVSACTGGKFVRASDPWVDFSPTGTAFYFSLVLDPAAGTPFGTSSGGMLVSRSRTHGQSWGPPTSLIIDKTPLVLNDKNSLTADPTAPGLAYAVWDRLEIFPAADGSIGPAWSGLAGDGVAIARDRVARLRAQAATNTPAQAAPPTKGPTFLSRTGDDGSSWSKPEPIYDPGVNAQTIDNLVVVPPSGDVLDFFTNIDAVGNLSIGYVRSTDQSFSFSGPTFATDIQVVGTITPNAHQPVRDASILYAVATDHASGALYLAWQDCRFGPNTCTSATPVDGIAFSQSLDGGATWSAPVMINQTPQNLSNVLRQQAFVPAIVVAGDGTVIVTYYDFRNDVGTSGVELTDDWVLFCKPGLDCGNPASWGNELRLTRNSFNMLDAPVAGGHFLGDYMGLAASGLDAWAVFGQATGPNLTDLFVRHISLPGGPVASTN